MTEVREFIFTEILEMVVDPNTRVGAEVGEEYEMNLKAGTIIVRRRVDNNRQADIASTGPTLKNVALTISNLTNLVNNSVSFTTSVVRDGKTFTFEWLVR